MIFQIGEPLVFLGMGLGYVVAVLVHNLAQSLAARSIGDPVTRMSRRRLVDPKQEFEAFGIIVMIVAGLGWGRPVPLTEPRNRGARKGRYIAALLAGPAADLLVGSICVAAYALLSGIDPQGSERFDLGSNVNAGTTLLGLVGVLCIAIGFLYLIPLPPLDGARIMWALAPPTAGWQKARYNLEEQNYGLGALVILSFPLFSGQGLIVRIVYAVAQPFIDLITGLVA